MQFALAADAVGIVAAVNMTQVYRRCRHLEQGIAETGGEFIAPLQDLGKHQAHAVQGIVAQRWVTGMAGAAGDADAFHGDALVQADGFQARGFADEGMTSQLFLCICQGPCAAHGAFLVGRGENHQGLPELAGVQVTDGFEYQREEAFHVGAAQAVQPVVPFGQFEGVGAPAAAVEGHGVRMPGQHQAFGTAACRGNEIELAGIVGNRQFLRLKAQVVQPVLQQVDDTHIRLVPFGADTAYRGLGDEAPHHVQ